MRRKRWAVACLTAFTTLALLPGMAMAADPDTITVSATGTVDIKADTGTAVFGVASRSQSAAEATHKLARRTRRLLRALKEAALSGDEISSEDIRLVRVCLRDCRDPHPRDDHKVVPVLGYAGSAGVRFESSHLKNIGHVVDVGVTAGATSIRRVFFDVKDKNAAVQEALSKAMDLAIAKATTLAEAASRNLGQASIIIEGRIVQPRAFGFSGDAVYASVLAAPTSESNPFPIKPPILSASGHIQVTFLLE
jgi:uncharacterized protein YggE